MKLFVALFLVCGIGFANSLEIAVSLSPAGSFVAKSEQVKIEGELKTGNGAFKARNIAMDINSLTSGIELRDEHMKKKYFEIKKFPKAILSEAQGSGGKFKGKLVVHGVSHLITGEYEMADGSLEAKFKCKLSDFKISEAKYMGVGVEDEVAVSVKLQGN